MRTLCNKGNDMTMKHDKELLSRFYDDLALLNKEAHLISVLEKDQFIDSWLEENYRFNGKIHEVHNLPES